MANAEDKQSPMYEDWQHARPIGGAVLTMLAIIAWLAFILVYALFWSGAYDLFQNLIVTVVTLGITGMVIGLGWLVWGARHVKRWN